MSGTSLHNKEVNLNGIANTKQGFAKWIGIMVLK
jgi:hypothetical protein